MPFGGSLGAQYFFLGERTLADILATYTAGNSITLSGFGLDDTSVLLDPPPYATSTSESVPEQGRDVLPAPSATIETPAVLIEEHTSEPSQVEAL